MNVTNKYDLGDINTSFLTVKNRLDTDSYNIENVNTELETEVETLNNQLDTLIKRVNRLIIISTELETYQSMVEKLL